VKKWHEFFNFILNGIVAAIVHFFVLIINIEILHFKSAGVANFIAAIFGLSVSFFGNRYFVFRKHDEHLVRQAIKFLILYILVACFFLILYILVACFHGLALYIWTDMYTLKYLYGFFLISFIAVFFSYFGNKLMVFKT